MRYDAPILEMTQSRDETSRQVTTFNLAEKTKTVPLPRGQRTTIGEVEGHGYITQMWLTYRGWFWPHWDANMPISPTILKTVILRIYWDGEKEPAVQAPVGDFFGNGLCEMSNFTSKYFGMSSGGFFCKFPMPFRKGFRIEMENLDEICDTDIHLNVLYQVPEEVPADCRYFHAQFHTARNPGPEPMHVLDAVGNGHFAGCVVSAQGEQRNYFSFLEAPEYIYVDDDWETPRIVGTGLEDYFLGGWYFREGEFAGTLHGVPSKDAINASIAMYRVHEADAIRFRRRMRFEFVNPWDSDRLKPFAYSAAAFYYVDSPAGREPAIPKRGDLLCWYRIKNTDHQSIP